MADIIRDSSGARQKFGFGGEPGSVISSAPKLTNQWFLEFKTTDGKNAEEYSAYAKSVSPITVQTQTQPIDKYGRRIYVPTRVDFPEVSVSLYDKVDGSTMSFVQELYKRYFKNQDMNVDTGLVNELDSTANSGRKLVGTDDAFRSFSSITLYHWFGDQKNGGHAQRIVLVNPVITSITFSNSDYAVSEVRVIDINLQPENVVFGAMESEAAIPSWMNLGISSEQQATSLATDPLAGVDDTRNQARNQASNNSVTDPTGGTAGETRRPMTEEEKVRLRELQRARRNLDATNADNNAGPNERRAAQQRYDAARSNSPLEPVASVVRDTKQRAITNIKSRLLNGIRGF